ncbi:MAG: NAD(P)H-dependent oxidoreductase [Pseudomonadota bacterium]
MSPVRLAAFSGSTREGSTNTKLVGAIAAIASEMGADVNVISLADHAAPLYDPELEAKSGIPESIKALQAIWTGSDAIFVASPEYNGSVTPLLKNTIDWISRVSIEGEERSLAFRKPVWSLGAVSPGSQGGVNSLYQLRPIVARLGAIVMPEQLTVGDGFSAFTDDGGFTNERTTGLAQTQVARLLDVAGKLKA